MAIRNLVVTFRTLAKHPAFTLTAILTIALGVGASTAIFSVTNAVLLQPLPYKDPSRLVIAGMDLRKRNVHGLPLSNADYIDLREGTKALFSDFAGVFTNRLVVPREDGTPEQVRLAIVTTNFFQLTGGRVQFGRDFTVQDGMPQPKPPQSPTTQGTPPPRLPQFAILSYEYFQKRYGANAGVLGHSITIPGAPGPVIVGVLAPGFRLYFPPSANVEAAPDIWIANRLDYNAAERNSFSILPVGRLKIGASLANAQSAADSVAEQARKSFPIDQSAGYYLTLAPMQQHLVAEVRPAILALMGSVIFLLLIACANVANLLLVRSSLREHEFALRAALGGNRWRLISPLLLEALLLAAMGTVLGLALAWAGIRELRILAPANLPRLEDVRMDGFVLGYTALAGLAAAAIFGIAPALRASKPALMNVLRGASRTAGFASGAPLRNMVVMAEVALSFVLLIGSGLMFRSFLELQRVDPGFDAHNLLTFQIIGGQQDNTAAQRAVAMRQINERLRSIPGVQNVTASFPFPLTGSFSPIRWGTEEARNDPSKFQATEFQIVRPGYFETMHTALLEGRTFTDDDNLPGRNRVIVDDLLARKAFPKESPIGKRILIRIRTPEPEAVEIVGVVAHQRTNSLAEIGREQVYFADAFLDYGNVRSWAIRTGSNAASYTGEVRAAIKGVDPNLLVTEMETGDSILYSAQAGTRFSLLLISVFALVAVALAGIGLYGVLSTVVRQRTSEVGVRMALGAARGDIIQLIVLQGLRLSAIGIAVGIVAAFILGRVISAMLVGVKSTDPATFAAVTIVFLAISTLASLLPARRAAALDPNKALREQ